MSKSEELSKFLREKGTQEAATLLDRYAQEEFSEAGIEYDQKQEKYERWKEKYNKIEAYKKYLGNVAPDTDLNDKRQFVKAALIPRTGEQTSIIKFMFNPTELNMSRDLTLNFMEGARTTAGLPKISFGYVNPYSIELAGLLFDTYETGEDVIEKYIDPIRDSMDFTKFSTAKDFVTVNNDGSVEISDFVTRGTSTAAALSGDTVKEYDDFQELPMTSKRPPVYYFIWGERNYMMCFIQKINYKLTMFLPNGTPVRAIVDLSLQEVDMRRVSRRYSMPQRMTAK